MDVRKIVDCYQSNEYRRRILQWALLEEKIDHPVELLRLLNTKFIVSFSSLAMVYKCQVEYNRSRIDMEHLWTFPGSVRVYHDGFVVDKVAGIILKIRQSVLRVDSRG